MAVATNTKLKDFLFHLEGELKNRGFKKANTWRLKQRLMDGGLLARGGACRVLREGESFFSRGIASRSSGFGVFAKEESGRVLVYCINPDTSPNAPKFPWDDKRDPIKGETYDLLKVYDGLGSPSMCADSFARDIAYFASFKPATAYWMESNVHAGKLHRDCAWNPTATDNSGSALLSLMRVLALTNRDVVALTPHNTFDARQFKAMAIIGEELGITVIPAVKLTMPSNPDLPHVYCYLSTAMAADTLLQIAFNNWYGTTAPYPGNARGFEAMMRRLHTHMGIYGTSELFMALAHPFNLYAKGQRPPCGIGSQGGASSYYPFYDISGSLHFFSATEAWNVMMGDREEVPLLNDPQFSAYMQKICARHLAPGTRITPNSVAWAFAKEVSPNGPIPHALVGTDNYYTPDVTYPSRNLPQIRGHTEIDMGMVYAGMARFRIPSSGELVNQMLKNEITLNAQMHLEEQNGFLRVPDGRA